MKKNTLLIVLIAIFWQSNSQTIPPPVGVTCASNDNTFVLTAEFDDFDGWTGDLTNTNDGGKWEIPGDSGTSGTGPDEAFSGANYMNFEASGGNSRATASAITPVIDLSTATGSAELSFYMHAFGENMGALEVGISNSVTGPFDTILFRWSGQLQTSGADEWVPVGINLDDYLGQIVYLEFKNIRADRGRGDMSIDLVRVETCGEVCLSPYVTINEVTTNVTDATVNFSWTANNDESSWDYVIQPAGTGIPTTGIATTETTITQDGLAFDTTYEVYVRSNCDSGTSSIWAGPVTFATQVQTKFNVDCTVGPFTKDICYKDGGRDNPEIFSFTSTDGTPLRLNFYSGFIQEGFDPLVVIDSDGTFIVPFEEPFVFGDLSGLSYTSTGDTISFYIASDNFGNPTSCAGGTFPYNSGITVEVSCNTCDNAEATYTIIDDCNNGNQFLVDVNVNAIGSATSLLLSNNIDANTTSITETGTYQIGPFPFSTDVVFTLNNNQDVNCVFNSLPIRFEDCLPDNDECENATIAGVNTDLDDCTVVTSGTIVSGTPSIGIPLGSCEGDPDDDVWFQFTALNDTQIIDIKNIVSSGLTTPLNHSVYEGACGSLNQLYCSDTISSITPQLVIGNTYYVRIFSSGSRAENVTFDLCIRPGINNIVVDQTTFTIEELVRDVLIGSECAQVSGISSSTGIDFDTNQPNGIGYFTMDGPGFPFEKGLLITTGNALEATGPNTSLISSGGGRWQGDEDLSNLLDLETDNASIIEFDFIPLSNKISFDFLMASEEYTGQADECDFSDAFAFFLTDPNGNVTNLAVLPNTDIPISITNVHPVNDTCDAINEEFFDRYLLKDLPPTAFDGRTIVFTAESDVIIGESYHIKLVVADEGDVQFDTGIFFKAGSFDLGELSLGDDITIDAGNAGCSDEAVVLNTLAPNLDHVWFKDGIPIDNETSSILTVNTPGVYTAQAIVSNNCFITDEVTVEFLPTPIANTGNDLTVCSSADSALFNLSENDSVILGTQNPTDYTITYHISEQDAIDGINPITSNYTNTTNPQTIYARVADNVTNCFANSAFNISTSLATHTAESVDIIECDLENVGTVSFDLAAHNVNVLNGQDASLFTVSYHTSEAEAMAGTGALPATYSSSGETLFVRVASVALPDCYVITSFDLLLGDDPITSFPLNMDYEVCPNASNPITIEAIPENYSLSNVSVTWYQDGDVIAGETSLTLPVLKAGLYEIEVVFNDTGCIGVNSQVVTELSNCIITQGISPNDDGDNDSFDLSSYNVSRLQIYNRHGRKVYSKTSYTDEWHGQSDAGDELPVGTYFYLMEYQGDKTRTDWIYLNREN